MIHASPTFIGIDGLDGCRKTTLAHELAGHTHHQVVSVDTFLNKNKRTYVDYIDYDGLRQAVQRKDSIIEGVCLLKVIERIGLSLDLAIYVEQRHFGVWEGEDCLGLDQNVDDFLRKLGKKRQQKEDLYSEIIRYHHEFRPHEKADLTFFWNDT